MQIFWKSHMWYFKDFWKFFSCDVGGAYGVTDGVTDGVADEAYTSRVCARGTREAVKQKKGRTEGGRRDQRRSARMMNDDQRVAVATMECGDLSPLSFFRS
jgi:hypothetical protein